MLNIEKLWQAMMKHFYKILISKSKNIWELFRKILTGLAVLVILTIQDGLVALFVFARKPVRIWHIVLLVVIGFLVTMFFCK